MSFLSSRPARVAAVAVLQLGLVGVAVSGQLSARLAGDEYTFRVQPLDPIDPFRGAYVALDYPDLALRDDSRIDERERGDLFLPLVKEGKFWRSAAPTRDRPAEGPFLACTDRDWMIECGIESWFLPQDKAVALEKALLKGDVIAKVKIDGRGNAALVAVEADPPGM